MLDAASSGDKFITDYFDKDLSANARINAGTGLSVRNVGVNLLVDGSFSFEKPANALTFSYGGTLTESMPITLGSKYSIPFLAEFAYGFNIKPIMQQSIQTEGDKLGIFVSLI